mgnify:CR=1 FL=1
MESQEAIEYLDSDNRLGTEEKEFTVGLTKKGKELSIHSDIRSINKKLMNHTHIEPTSVTVYDAQSDEYERMLFEEFSGQGKIISAQYKAPMGLLKLGSKPRSSGGFSTIVSGQTQVNIE